MPRLHLVVRTAMLLAVAAAAPLAKAQVVVFSENFRTPSVPGVDGTDPCTFSGGAGNFPFPAGWLLRNVDNRPPNSAVAFVNQAWEVREDFGTNSNVNCVAFSTSWTTPTGVANDFMWTPPIAVPANAELSWRAKAYDPDFADGYEVRIMTVPPTGGDGVIGNQLTNSTVLFSIASEQTTFATRTVSLAAFAGQTVYIGFRNNSNDQFLLVVDDVQVTGSGADLAITKTDGVATATAGGSVTYTITASNTGSGANPVTVADTFPAGLSCTWTCVGAGGATCAASGSGNINDTTVNLPGAGSVTYTAACTISPAATGTLSNTATVSSALPDPNPANNSATDVTTLGASANLSIAKDDGVKSVTPGGSTTYTITASNAGPSNAPGSTVTDTFPAGLTCTWTCAGAGGGTCTASGNGNISDTVNLPAGAATTYTAVCAIATSVTGSLTNTATVAVGAGVTDPDPANNSESDFNKVIPPGVLGILGALVEFGPQRTGGITPRTLTVTNTGGSPLTVSSVSPVAAPFFQVAGGTCTLPGFTIPAGGQCTILYEFRPTDAGLFTQAVTIVSDVGQVSVTLRGTGVNVTQLPVGGGLATLLLMGLLGASAVTQLRRRS